MKEPIEFTRESIKEYLDNCIYHWKDKKNKAMIERSNKDSKFKSLESTEELRAIHYIEAFQDVRLEIFGEKL